MSGKRRKGGGQGQGATRKREAQTRSRPDFGAWLNRLLVLAGFAVVGAAALQAWRYLDGIPVEQIRVTGQLEHVQREAVQELVHPGLVGGFLSADLGSIRERLEGLDRRVSRV